MLIIWNSIPFPAITFNFMKVFWKSGMWFRLAYLYQMSSFWKDWQSKLIKTRKKDRNRERKKGKKEGREEEREGGRKEGREEKKEGREEKEEARKETLRMEYSIIVLLFQIYFWCFVIFCMKLLLFYQHYFRI